MKSSTLMVLGAAAALVGFAATRSASASEPAPGPVVQTKAGETYLIVVSLIVPGKMQEVQNTFVYALSQVAQIISVEQIGMGPDALKIVAKYNKPSSIPTGDVVSVGTTTVRVSVSRIG
jgi:hypothetical protein